ncbi:right-handed parallel beta-helix repeat-containing protein [Salinispora arenicola]|uniref:right-handed parallel beta-helix repeat-containing protein n=1 Tax=Salinispora arenicola TaxID=168697 RepID=UPI001430C18E|nr:right-handed parallel beta-helix repeat-containing protein [Salinispora arenicola]NIL44106.1 right-handed parallel beta-helix repeat-containing protein [Salinispora arenicola]
MTGKDTKTAMNDQCHEHELDRPGARRARSRWWAVGLAGMTGLALTTSLGIGGAPAFGAVDGILTAADDRRGKPDRASTDNKDYEGKGKQGKRRGTPVPCSADALIAAITLANARGGAVLDLAKDCTYLLTANIDDGAGLPAITTPITLNGGKDTTIKRAAAAEQFRILSAVLNSSKIIRNVSNDGDAGGVANIGGDLVINHSVIGHNTASNVGGGVFSIGTLTVDSSRFDANTASAGGGFATVGNFRITRSELVNHVADDGGGIFIFGTTFGRISDTRIERNTATSPVGTQGGAAISGAPAQLTVSGVTIANNTTTGDPGLGAIFLQGGSMLVEDSVIKNNAGVDGGGIRNLGTLTLLRTKVIGNQATESGGGISNGATGALTLFDTKVVKNIAAADGGGIFNEAGGTVNLNTATGTVVAKNRPNNCVNVTGCPD